jgi:hypothetical protein
MNRHGLNCCGPLLRAVLVSLCWAIAPEVEARIRVVVRTVGHQILSGELVEFSLDGGVRLLRPETREPITIPPVEVVRIHNSSSADVTTAPLCVLLVGGDTVMRKRIAIPLDRVRGCLTPQARLPQWQKRAEQLIGAAQSTEDRLLMANGDMLRGFVVRIAPEKITFEHAGREVEIDPALMVALAMVPEPYTVGDAPRARLEFVDGSTLTVSRVRWTPDGLDLTFFDGSLQGLSPEALRSAEIRGGRWTWLSSLTPLKYEHTPLLTMKWSYSVDKNVLGGPLSIGGRPFESGIGVHSRSVLTYDLAGQYREFTTQCGLDDSAGLMGDVTAAIIVDGEVKWEQRHMRGGEQPQAVRIDVSGARALTLRVDFGANGDVRDRFDWADAALIR